MPCPTTFPLSSMPKMTSPRPCLLSMAEMAIIASFSSDVDFFSSSVSDSLYGIGSPLQQRHSSCKRYLELLVHIPAFLQLLEMLVKHPGRLVQLPGYFRYRLAVPSDRKSTRLNSSHSSISY